MLYTSGIYVPMSSPTPQTLLGSILGPPITVPFPDRVKSSLLSVERVHSTSFNRSSRGLLDLAVRAGPVPAAVLNIRMHTSLP